MMFILPVYILKKMRCGSLLNFKNFACASISQVTRFSSKTFQTITPKLTEESNSKSAENETDLPSELTKWGVQNNISHIALSQLLKILNQYGIESLPKNSRVILEAKERKIKVLLVPPGEYAHYGLENNLKILIAELEKKKQLKSSNISISVFVDNLPLSQITQQGLWAILGSITGFPNAVFLIGTYRGYAKPNNANLFLTEFVEEAKSLCQTGIEVNARKYTLTIKRVVCDAPAKAFILNIKNFAGYSSCTKCDAEGQYVRNKICFPDKSNLRTDKDFEEDKMYLNEKTKLLEIPNFGVVSNVPLDYLHLICVGVLKKMLTLWLSGKKKYWFSCSSTVQNFPEFKPTEFATKPKTIVRLSQWTPFEFRQFLLYYGPVVLKNALKEKYYNHFLYLHAACRILNNTEHNDCIIKLGEELFSEFVTTLKTLYGAKEITHNIHGLYHLADDCKLHGALDNFSAFSFEKFLIKLRKSLRKCKKRSWPYLLIDQSSKNIFIKSLSKIPKNDFQVQGKLLEMNTNIPDTFKNATQYTKLKIKNMWITPMNRNDKFVLLENGKIVEVSSILVQKEISSKDIYITGKEYLTVSSFYEKPLTSSLIEIFTVSNISNVTNVWPVKSIKRKCMSIPLKNDESVVIGLLNENF